MTLSQIDPNKNKHLVLIWTIFVPWCCYSKGKKSIQVLPNNKLLTIKKTEMDKCKIFINCFALVKYYA